MTLIILTTQMFEKYNILSTKKGLSGKNIYARFDIL